MVSLNTNMNTIQQPKTRKQRKQEKDLAYLLDEIPITHKETKRRKVTPEEHLVRTYGITLAEKQQMILSQSCMCGICCKNIDPKDASSVAVDHCHATGKVRGILCRECNLMIGLARDNEQILANAIHYLKSSKMTNV